uniref:Uncharacterized protein n=1 Tax=Physcomitrium patens TaxID=3218 RepID=A0A2K1JGC1_PHYPA|nr:hypothetical protein PHYPA_018008 [Physcomitrium patens]
MCEVYIQIKAAGFHSSRNVSYMKQWLDAKGGPPFYGSFSEHHSQGSRGSRLINSQSSANSLRVRVGLGRQFLIITSTLAHCNKNRSDHRTKGSH